MFSIVICCFLFNSVIIDILFFFFFSSRRRHTRLVSDWSSDVCSSDLHVRLRPILMTTIAIIAGMIPIAFGRGAGAGSRASMAVTIIGGQTLCLLLTLLVTPVVYSYFDDVREMRPGDLLRRLIGRRPHATA